MLARAAPHIRFLSSVKRYPAHDVSDMRVRPLQQNFSLGDLRRRTGWLIASSEKSSHPYLSLALKWKLVTQWCNTGPFRDRKGMYRAGKWQQIVRHKFNEEKAQSAKRF